MSINSLAIAKTSVLELGNTNSGEIVEGVEKNIKQLPSTLDLAVDWLKAFALQAVIAIILFIVLRKLTKVILKAVSKVLERSRIDEGVSRFLLSVIKVISYFIIFIVILQAVGYKAATITAAITAIIGSAGLTIGLALQGSLQNFSGGVLILLLKPFRIGDYIIANGYEGTVESIDVFYTKLLTIDNRMVVLPNGELSNANITNVTKENIRRLDLSVSIEYSENIQKVKTVLTRIAESKELVLKDRDIMVFVDDFEASSIKMGMRVWCLTENYWILRWDMLESIKNAFDENDIVIPFDQLDINLKEAINK